MKRLWEMAAEGARAAGELSPELEAFYAEQLALELAGKPLTKPQVAPSPASAAQARAHEKRVDDAIPSGSHDPRRIAPKRRHRNQKHLAETVQSERYRRHLGELARRGARACRPVDVPRRVYGGCRGILCDPKGEKGRLMLHEVPPAFASKLYACATEGGRPLSHVKARAILSTAWFFFAMGRPTTRRGYALVSDGIPIGTVRSVIFNPVTGQPYSRSGLCATSWGKHRRAPHECGAMAALRRHGIIFRVQPPAALVPLALVGPSGYAFAQTWISEHALYGDPPENAAPPSL